MSRTVVIAGGGPTGLMLACELRLAGVEVVVLDKLPEAPQWSRAQTFQARSLESFRQRGLSWFDDYGQARTYNFGLLELKDIIAPELVAKRVPQRDVEQRLEEHALKLGADVRRVHEVVGLEQDEDGVTVEVRSASEEYRLRGAYLVGCDGGSSTVRKLAGIAFPGTSSSVNGITGDVDLINPNKDAYGPRLTQGGVYAQIPMEAGVHRLTTMEFDVVPPSRDLPLTTDEFAAAVKRVMGIDVQLGERHLLSRFGSATRLAERYRAGRVFLAGDAAHIHLPFGGQGLNTGVQDAINLGWKLAAAVQGWAPPGLLDSYHEERHPVGARLTLNTQAQEALLHPLNEVQPLRDLFTDLLQFEEVRDYLVDVLTALGIRYPAPGGEEEQARAHPLLGRRVPLVDLETPDGPSNVALTLHTARGVVLDTSGRGLAAAAAAPWAERVDVVEARPAEGIPEGVLLVRPDGYAAFVDPDGTDGPGLREALGHWFGEGRPQSAVRA
ncbi:FAD-dependent monooxygenase [Kitasatospora sp. NPDC056184]|uniref:FAD-dependent monooxygenase n=1 Tax=Kitasatospora sp. NPDC056184 TaxID=3345738 RepID=UPI0035DA58A9